MAQSTVTPFSLLERIFANVSGIVGDGVSYSLLHFGAVEEGKRIGRLCGRAAVQDAVAQIAALADQKTIEVRVQDGSATVTFAPSAYLQSAEPTVRAIIPGLLEGAFTGALGAPYRLQNEERPNGLGGNVVMSFKKE